MNAWDEAELEVEEGEEAGSSTSRRGGGLRCLAGFAAQPLGLFRLATGTRLDRDYPTMLLIREHVSAMERRTSRNLALKINDLAHWVECGRKKNNR